MNEMLTKIIGPFAMPFHIASLCSVAMLTLCIPLRTEGIVYIADQGFELGYVSGAVRESHDFTFAGISPGLEFSGPTDERPWWDIGALTRTHFQAVFDEVEEFPALARLNQGVGIRDGLDWRGFSEEGLAGLDGSGNFFDSEGYLAIRAYFETGGWEIEDALPFYGWIRISHNAEESVLTVHDWAWNSTPGEPILAGQIPEPKVYALLLGIGVLAFVAGRRRQLRHKMEKLERD